MNIPKNEFKVNSPEERLKLISAALNTRMPATILGEHGEPTDQLLDFCRKTGASLDWIFVDIEPIRQKGETETKPQSKKEETFDFKEKLEGMTDHQMQWFIKQLHKLDEGDTPNTEQAASPRCKDNPDFVDITKLPVTELYFILQTLNDILNKENTSDAYGAFFMPFYEDVQDAMYEAPAQTPIESLYKVLSLVRDDLQSGSSVGPDVLKEALQFTKNARIFA